MREGYSDEAQASPGRRHRAVGRVLWMGMMLVAGLVLGLGASIASVVTTTTTKPKTATGKPANVRPPIATVTKPIGIKLPPGPTSPSIYPLKATSNAVVVTWGDRASNEDHFVVFRRDPTGAWQQVAVVPTQDVAGSGETYSWVDTSTNLSGQCYSVSAVNSNGSGNADMGCTVRPDPARFPQVVPTAAVQWYGLDTHNDGTGDLDNSNIDMGLTWSNQTFGVDLDWIEGNTLWKVEDQGSPTIMYGEAVALRVWGGGWLKYGNETFGVDLQLSSTPSYEWYLLPNGSPAPGTPAEQDFALWNSASHKYLVRQGETWGVSLGWSDEGQGSTSNQPVDATVTMNSQPPVSGYVPFLGGFGGGPGNTTVLTNVSEPANGVPLLFVKPGHSSSDCGNSSDVITLVPGGSLTAAQMQTLWGSATPSLSQRLPFLACAVTQQSVVFVNVQYLPH